MPEATAAPTGTSVGANPIPSQIPTNIATPAPGTVPDKPETQAQDKKAPAEPKSFKTVKIDGKELQLDEDTYHRYVQKGIGAEKRYAEAAKLMREAQARIDELSKKQAEIAEKSKRYGDEPDWDYLIDQAKGDPQRLAKVRQKAEQWLISQLELEAASPEAQELARQKAENERIRKENEDYKKQAQAREMEQLTAKHRATIESTIMEALEISGLPKTEWNVRHMADLMSKAIRGKYELTPQQLALQVKSERIDNNKAILGEYAKGIIEAYKNKDSQKVAFLGKAMEELFTPEVIDAVRAYDLTNLSAAQPNIPKPVVETPATEKPLETRKSHYLSEDEERERRQRVAAEAQAEFDAKRRRA